VNDPAFEQGASRRRPIFGLNGEAPDIVHELGGEAVSLCAKELAADLPRYRGFIGFAKPGSRLNQSLKHRLEIEGRAADDLEHVGRSSLLLQRFSQLVEQARVLDRDDGLVGEVLDQLDLLVSERAHLLAIDIDATNQVVVLEHGNAQYGPKTG
jgi:hypothetical protein